MSNKELVESAAYSSLGLLLYYVVRGFFNRTLTSFGFPFVVGY